tara:strand:- start:47 stop:388 length:342 start_codon:yes stop_codon:yes gene_type:complete
MNTFETMIIKSGPIGKWEPNYESMSGCISWDSKDSNERYNIWATPDWENDLGITPVEISDSEGEYYQFNELQLEGTLVERLATYREAMRVTIGEIESGKFEENELRKLENKDS